METLYYGWAAKAGVVEWRRYRNRKRLSLATLSQGDPDNNKNNNGTQATAAEFFGAVAGNKTSKDIVHICQDIYSRC